LKASSPVVGRAAARRCRGDGERAVVLPSDRLAGERRRVLPNLLLQERIVAHVTQLILASEPARKREQADGEGDQDPEDDAEGIEEMGIGGFGLGHGGGKPIEKEGGKYSCTAGIAE
jgi:hypothetical protein